MVAYTSSAENSTHIHDIQDNKNVNQMSKLPQIGSVGKNRATVYDGNKKRGLIGKVGECLF